MPESVDAVVIGSGPNGLAAAIFLQQAGHNVLVLEAAAEPGGGTGTRELTLPGFLHDQCSAVHPTGILSPFFRRLPLGEHGLEWLQLPAGVAHPLDGQPGVILYPDFARTLERLDAGDRAAWQGLMQPFLRHPYGLLEALLGPLRLPRHPLMLARFGLLALQPATFLARRRFSGARARALFAGCAAHSILPLSHLTTAAMGLVFAITAHVESWPVARGGSAAISRSLVSFFRSLGGRIETGRRINSPGDLPPHRLALYDVSPKELIRITGNQLPAGYVRRLQRYQYGPGTFKIDWALDGPIPWKDPAMGEATTVHVGGTMEEIAASELAAWQGRVADKPYLILCQQSAADPGRAPAGQHTGYAYCHVPFGFDGDRTRAIEDQVERFAPGFRDRILARHTTTPGDFERMNPNYVGGAITGGAAHIGQLFTRPVARLDPYTTPHPRIMLCSAATPPGGGVHGMCGYRAALTADRRLRRRNF